MADTVENVADTSGVSSDTFTVENVVDLRPAADSMKAELVRLGLSFDHVDDATNIEIWRDYARHLMAEFTSTADSVKLTDLRTGISKDMSLDDLKNVTRIIVSGEKN